MIQEKSSAFGNWILTDGKQQTHCRLNGFILPTAAVCGAYLGPERPWHCAVGMGMFARYIERGELVRVLPPVVSGSDITRTALNTRRSSSSDRIQVCIDFLTEHLAQYLRAVKHRAYCISRRQLSWRQML